MASVLRDEYVHVVGGAVRDRLLKRPVLDVDLIVPQEAPRIAARLAQTFNAKAFPLDTQRGIERVALREDVHIDIANWQAASFEEDIDRRDFTINALAVPLPQWASSSWKKAIIDRHKGLRDLQKKVVTPVSHSIFKDDPLRLLRAFRQAAQFNLTLSPALIKMAMRDKNLLKKVSPERMRDELLQLLSVPAAHPFLVLMDKTRVLDVFWPEAKALRQCAVGYYGKGGVLKHTLDSVFFFEEIHRTLADWFPSSARKISDYLDQDEGGYPLSAHCKWAVLLHDVGKPATAQKRGGRLRFFEHEHVGADAVLKMARRYRWSNQEAHRYARLVRHHMRPGNLATQERVTDKAIHRFFRDLGDDALSMLLVSLADHLTYLTAAQRRHRHSSHERVTMAMIHRYTHSREKILPVKILDGHQLMKAFQLKPSPLIGRLLADLQEAQCEKAIQTPDQALAYLKSRLEWHQSQCPPAE